VELAAARPSGLLSAAAALVAEAQAQREPAAWITPPAATFFPPDFAENGVDLGALAVVRVEELRAMLWAADVLLRSGAFGLVVLDLTSSHEPIPLQAQTRLVGLAKQHHAALVCLCAAGGGVLEAAGHELAARPATSQREPGAPRRAAASMQLGSLRAEVARRRTGEDRFLCRIEVVKDKRRGPLWRGEHVCRGPMGLR
jgi:recombination protein RecA